MPNAARAHSRKRFRESIGWRAHGFRIALAGRHFTNESDAELREGFAKLIAERGWRVDARDPAQLVIFPEMDANVDVPEITTACWEILAQIAIGCDVRDKPDGRQTQGGHARDVLACTLIPYDAGFELGATLARSKPRSRAQSSALREILRAGRGELQREVSMDFWYEFASTYSYPAAMRVQRVADAAGVSVRFRPFLLGPIFGAQGWNNSPFNIYPAKGRYMWRDLARICEAEAVPLREPVRFPQNGLKAARIALVGEKEGWIVDFTRAVYTANFAERRDIADDATLGDILRRLDIDTEATIAAANTPENKERLKKQTDEAISLGIFGAPSFTVNDELFWGNDRLEEAVKWAKK